MDSNFISILWFIILGLVGGIAHVTIDAESWEDLMKFDSFKKALLGALCGFIYFNLYSEYNFPNAMMTIVSGYMGTDFILGIIKKFNPLEMKGGEG